MSSDEISGKTFTPEGTGPDGRTQIGDDLPAESRDTLAAYLSSLTTSPQNGNAFKIDPNNPVTEISLRQDNGLPSEFTTGGSDETVGFTDKLSEVTTPRGPAPAVPVFETLSDGMYNISIADDGTQTELINKNSQTEGHTLLSNVRSTGDANDPGIGNTSGKTSFPLPLVPPRQLESACQP